MDRKDVTLSRLSLAIGLALVASSPSQLLAYEQDKSYQLTILHTNDHHGRFWHNEHGEYGMAARKTLIDRIRQEVEGQGGSVLLLSGGDINTGVPESDLQDAEPDFKGMNKIGYDAMALGNHEFDNALEVLFKQKDWAGFPFLSANIYAKDSGQRLFDPYHIFERQGLKIGVLGLTTEDTAKIGNPEFLANIEFRNPINEASQLVPELRSQVDVLIAATHMGHYEDAKHGINAPGDVSLARQVKGLDMIIGGHSQDPVCMSAENQVNAAFQPGDACMPDSQNGTLIMQAHEWGKYVGRADFTFKNGELSLQSYQLIPVNLTRKVEENGEKKRVLINEEIPKDAELQAFLQPYQDKGQEELSVVVTQSDGRLEGDRKVVRFQPTNLGELIAVAQMHAAQADMAVVNSGGVRDSIEAGQITYKDLLKVQPFGNILSYVELSGKELKEYLAVVAGMPVDSGAFAQFGGARFSLKDGQIDNLVVTGLGEKTVEDNGTYRLALNSFIASGGDKYPQLDNHPNYVNTGLVDAAVFKSYLEKLGSLKVADYEPGDKVVRHSP